MSASGTSRGPGVGRVGSLRRMAWHVRHLMQQRADDLRLLAVAYASLLLVDLALRALGFRRLMAIVPKPVNLDGGRRVRASQHTRAGRFAFWLEVASRRHVIRARCLHRSLALHIWLRRKGLPSHLRIGVRKSGAALLAHAWVEMDGNIVNDHAAAVAPFSVLPALDVPTMLWKGTGR